MSHLHTHRRYRGWWVAITLPVLFITACSSVSKTTTKTNPTTTAATTTPAANATTPTPALNLTPVPGNYSVYVDQTWGYSFQYPSSWIVEPVQGRDGDGNVNESDVAITEPYTSTPSHPMTLIMIRATSEFGKQFVKSYMCGYKLDTTVAGLPARAFNSTGGDPVNGYTAIYYGRFLFAHGLAFQIFLQSSAKDAPGGHDYINDFFNVEKDNWTQLINSFNPGNGISTDNSGC